MDVSVAISMAGLCMTVCGFLLGQRQGAKKEGYDKGVLMGDLKNIKESVEGIRASVKEINISEVNRKLAVNETRLDALEEGVKDLTKRVNIISSK